VPAGLQGVIDRCLQKEAARRYSDVAELARALAPFGPPRSDVSVERIEHVLGLSHEAPLSLPVPATTGSRADSLTFSPTTSQAPRAKSARLLILPAAIVVAAAAVVLVFVGRSGKHDAATATPTMSSTQSSAAAPSAASLSTTAAPSNEPSPSSPGSSATAPPSAAPSHSPWWAGKPDLRPRPSAASSPSAPPAPTCHVESYFDADGNKHFKQVCP
jgi:serine/threonine-protein kinase